jgi:hypothetical protein
MVGNPLDAIRFVKAHLVENSGNTQKLTGNLDDMLLLDIFGFVVDVVIQHFGGGDAGKVLRSKPSSGMGIIRREASEMIDRRQSTQAVIQKVEGLLPLFPKFIKIGDIIENQPVGDVLL